MVDGWKKTRINDLIKESIVGDWGGEPKIDSQIAVIGTRNFQDDGEINFLDLVYRHINSSHLQKMLLKEGDILIEKSGGSTDKAAGRVVYVAKNFKGIFSNFVELLRIKESYDPKFIFYLLFYGYKTGRVLKYQQQTTGIINFKLKEYKKEEVTLPSSIKEQSKIAEVLSKIDEAIEQIEKLIEKNKLIKAGLMQDLFTKGIDEKGNIRSEKTHEFKNSPLGRIPEEWDASQINYIVTFIGSGVTPTGGSNVYKNEGVPFIRSQNVYDNGLRLDDIAFLTTEIDERMKRSRVENNDILLNITGASIGRCCSVPEGFPKANVNQHVCIIRLKNHTSDEAYYFSKFLSSFKGQNQIIMLNAGSNRQGLNYQQVRSIYVPYPKKEEERIKGAKLLRKIFFTISEEERKLIKLQHIKAGLMQDLLTGEVRVTPLMREAVVKYG